MISWPAVMRVIPCKATLAIYLQRLNDSIRAMTTINNDILQRGTKLKLAMASVPSVASNGTSNSE